MDLTPAPLEFRVPGTLGDYFESEKFISLAVGPVGSLKTSASIAKILYHASRMAPCKDGVRRSRAVWVRQTREQLRDTSIPDFLKFFPDGVYGSYLKSEYRYILRVGDIECDVLFRGLDDSNDVRRLLSLNISFGIVEEFRELNANIFEALQGRLGRYPDGSMVPHRPEWGVDDKGNPVQGCVRDDGGSNKLIWGGTNPPDFDSYWENFLSSPPENAHVTIQPSALSEDADWLKFLPSGYYDNLVLGKSQDYIDVYVHARFGRNLSGQPVFRSFDRALHVAASPLRPNVMQTVLVGMDAALNPAAVVGQMDYNGRLLVMDSLYASGMGALRFVNHMLKPLLASKYAGAQVMVIVDPSAVRRMDTDEKSVVDIVRASGLAVRPAVTNTIALRLAAVETFLTRLVDGKASITIDPGCTDLIKGLAGGYRYKVKKDGQVEDTPEKLHPISDILDSLQYLCLHADNGAVLGASRMQAARREVKPAPFRWAV